MKIPTGVAGASGYTGAELVRLLQSHPNFDLVWAGAASSAGDRIGAQAPGLFALDDLVLGDIAAGIPEGIELLFMALPSGEAAAMFADGRVEARWVVDLGADFRHKEPEKYEAWYGSAHPAPELLDQWAYGLSEWNRAEIEASNRIANPGCYSTAALLALLPIVGGGLLADGSIFVDGKSGVSGAGRSAARQHTFSEAYGDVSPYALAGHRHLPEIEDQLAALARGEPISTSGRVVFVPHLVPMARGLVDTCFVPVSSHLSQADLDDAFEEAYEDSPFVKYVGEPPHSKSVGASNCALVSAARDVRTDSAVVVCAIDNLVKGAAGQAIQNANLMTGLPEVTGLPTIGMWP